MPDFKELEAADRRQYKRYDSVFPVEYTIVRLQGDLPGLDLQNGSTRDIGKEGVCLETENLTESTLRYLRDNKIYLELRMSVPPSQPPIKVVAEVAWYHKESEGVMPRFSIGLKFRSIADTELQRLFQHAHWFKISSKFVVIVSIVIVCILILIGMISHCSY